MATEASMSRMDDRTLAELVQTLRERAPRALPDWTDGSQHDPGITLAELLVYLGEQLLARATELPASGRRDLARLGRRLLDLDPGGGGIEDRVTLSPLERVSYFSGQLLTADDYRAEQDYVRGRLRRLNRARHGTGVVAGLELSIAADTATPAVVVSPGLAIDPDGEEIVVSEPVSCPIVATGDAVSVTVRFVERPTAFAPVMGGTEDELRPTRIEEGFAVALESEPDPGGVVLGRVVRDASGWHVAPVERPHAPPGSL
jgi:hypothetical protein